MPEVSREEFLRIVRQSLDRSPPQWTAEEEEGPPPPSAPDPLATRELAPLFLRFLEEAGATVHAVTEGEGVRQILRDLCKRHGVRLAAVWDHPLLRACSAITCLEEMGIGLLTASMRDHLAGETFLSPEMAVGVSAHRPAGEIRPGSREIVDGERRRLIASMAEADLGLTGVDHAVADGGTLVLLAGEDRPRGTSLLPSLHVAVVSARQLVASLEEVFAHLKELQLLGSPRPPSCVTLISGPSKSGDIEQTLAVGVHGPRELHVILWGPGEDPTEGIGDPTESPPRDQPQEERGI